jgi:hypothetical protein
MDYVKLVCAMSEAYRNRQANELKEINDSITNGIMEQFSQEGVELAIMSYLLFKMLTKHRFEEEQKDILGDKLAEMCREGSAQDIIKSVGELNGLALEIEAGDRRYVIDLLTKARIKVAAKLYAKGISLGTVSKALGIPQQEIMSYAGKTMMFDRLKGEVGIKERMKDARTALGGN